MSAVASNQVDPLYDFYGFLKNSYVLGQEPLIKAKAAMQYFF